jgi:uncharacterized protein with NRDE domain
MCLIAFAWRSAPGQQLLLVANRDEMHARPTAPLAWWESPALLAGRDLAAGGTWLAVDARGRFGAVTNFRGAPTPPSAPSRGHLVPRFLAGTATPLEFIASLAAEAARYAGFSLILGDASSAAYFCNQGPAAPRELAPGVYALSNARLDTPWPKVVAARAALEARLGAATDTGALLGVLGDRSPAADRELPDTGVGLEAERRLSASFIVDPRYGTRSTTVLRLGTDGRGAMVERSFDALGRTTGTRAIHLRTVSAP